MRHRQAAVMAIMLLGLAAAAAYPSAVSAGAPPGDPPRGGRWADLLPTGSPAPDVELPRLVLEKDADGKSIAKLGDEKVRLPGPRGKRPVCLFLSSYT